MTKRKAAEGSTVQAKKRQMGVQRGGIRRQGKNSWQVRVPVGKDDKGRTVYRYFTVHGKREDAEAFRVDMLHKLHTGEYVEPRKETVAEYLRRWFALEKHSLSPIENHLIPDLGNVLLQKLTPAMLNAYYARKLQEERKDGRKGTLSPTTVRYHARVLHAALEAAVREGILARNPVDASRPPKPAEKEITVWSPEQVQKYLAALEGHPLEAMLRLAVSTGMRVGELTGLRWQDVDLNRGVVYVRQAAYRVKGGAQGFKPPKSKAGVRVLLLDTPTLAALKRHAMNQTIEMGGKLPELVFPDADGGPMKPWKVWYHHRKVAERAGLPLIRTHDLRHTSLSLQALVGADVKTLQARAGHASLQTTQRYLHLLAARQHQEILRRLEQVLSASRAG